MTLLKTVEELNEHPAYRVEVTFGHKAMDGSAVELAMIAEAKAYLRAVLIDVCGGGRMPPPRLVPHPGFYRHDDGSDVNEDSTTVAAVGFGEDIPYGRFRRACRHVARLLKAESVLLVIERVWGAAFFVRADAPDAPESDEGEFGAALAAD